MKNPLNLVAGLLAISLLGAGCQAGSDATPTAAGAKPGKRFKVGISIPAADHGWTAGLKYWAATSANGFPDIDWVIQDAKETTEQVGQLENFQTQGVDAVVLVPLESKGLTPIAKKLKAAGILLIDVSAGLTEPVADVFLEGDNKAFGRHAGEFLAQKLGGKGKIAVLEGLPCTVNTDRVTGAKEVLAKYPNIQIVADAVADWNREKAEKATENILAAQPQIDAIWAADDDMALGAESALKAAGREKNIWILGGGGMKDIVKRIIDKDPLYPGDITYPPSMVGLGVQICAGMLRAGKPGTGYVPRHLVLDLDAITPENAKDYYFPDSIY